MRAACWDLYIGSHIKTTSCPLCGINLINQNTNSGFELAHVVPQKFMGDDTLTVFSLYPSCAACNNNMRCDNLLDYLWCRGRFDQLRHFIRCVYRRFMAEHGARLPDKEKYTWAVLEHLYGPKRFPLGGFIVNREQIYNIAKSEQISLVNHRVAELSRQLDECTRELLLLSQTPVTCLTIL